jgi:P27 family predicted phage terminase small subunit
MQRGRKKLPPELKLIRGTERKDRELHSKKVPAGNARPPTHLDREAKREWRRRVAELLKLGIFGDRDRALLATWCSTWSRLVRAERVLAEKGDVHTTKNGYPVPRPELAIITTCGKTLERLAAHFGFSPVSRQRLELPIPVPPLPVTQNPEQDAGSTGKTPEEIERKYFST